MTSCWASLEFRLLGFQCSDRILHFSDSVPDILHTPLRSARCLAEDIVERWKNKGRRSRQKHSKQQDNTSMTVTVLVQGIRLFGYRRLYSISQSSLVNRIVFSSILEIVVLI